MTLTIGLTMPCHSGVRRTVLYTVSTFYTDAAGQRHPWAKPFVIADAEIGGYRETARALIDALLEEGQPDGPHPIGLELRDQTGEIVFAYLRPAPSQG